MSTNRTNDSLTAKGKPITVIGRALKVGDPLPNFKLVATDMTDIENSTFKGKTLIICSVPSLDTPVCSIEMKRFNQEAEKLSADTEVLAVSMDLPFAQARWCGAEGAKRVRTGSDYKYRTFGEAFGVLVKETGFLARAVFVADRSGTIKHIEYVKEITEEPDYKAALAAAPH